MVKLIVSDLDGTLLGKDNKIPDEFYTMLEDLKEKNILFSVASGRSYTGLRHLFNEKGEDIYYICDNGAFVKHGDDVISSNTFSKEDYKKIIEFLHKKHIFSIMVCGVKGTYYENTWDEAFNDKMKSMYTKMTFVNSVLDIDDEAFKISVFSNDDIRHRIFSPLKSRFEDDFSIHISAKIWVDIMNKGTDKGKALKNLQKSMGIDKNQTMAFGDYDNDIPMLECAKFSFAMENASDLVKKSCDYIAKANTENGVIRAVNKYILDKS